MPTRHMSSVRLSRPICCSTSRQMSDFLHLESRKTQTWSVSPDWVSNQARHDCKIRWLSWALMDSAAIWFGIEVLIEGVISWDALFSATAQLVCSIEWCFWWQIVQFGPWWQLAVIWAPFMQFLQRFILLLLRNFCLWLGLLSFVNLRQVLAFWPSFAQIMHFMSRSLCVWALVLWTAKAPEIVKFFFCCACVLCLACDWISSRSHCPTSVVRTFQQFPFVAE